MLSGPARLLVDAGVLLSSSSVNAEKSQELCPEAPGKGGANTRVDTSY